MTIRILTAGESHGKLLNTIIEGMPSGLKLSSEDINKHLARRQKGYGRGGRMKIETDQVEINSGVRHGHTIGSPISLTIKNKDWENWTEVMSADEIDLTNEIIQNKLKEKQIDHVRPGHADLSGTLKYDSCDIRNILERSSARETGSRVAFGAVCLRFLEEFKIDVFSHIVEIGSVSINRNSIDYSDLAKLKNNAENSVLRTTNKHTEERMIKEIDNSKETGDTLGGTIEIIASGLPIGLGSFTHWDKRLDSQIAQAIMSIPAIKSVEIGLGCDVAKLPGSKVHDEIFPGQSKNRFIRNTNNAGGIEGGMSNGENIIVRAAMKPIPTLQKPLRSITLTTGEPHIAHYERSDVCAVPAAGVVCESMLAYVLANAFLEKFSGDCIKDINNNYKSYLNRINKE